MTPKKSTDYGEIIKKKVADHLEHFLLLKDKKPKRVQVQVIYSDSIAKIDIPLND